MNAAKGGDRNLFEQLAARFADARVGSVAHQLDGAQKCAVATILGSISPGPSASAIELEFEATAPSSLRVRARRRRFRVRAATRRALHSGSIFTRPCVG
jgi:hypothetical protein